MDNSTRKTLLASAKNYKDYELQVFLADQGWDSWMQEYMDCEHADDHGGCECEVSEQASKRMDDIMKDIFDEAHDTDED